MQRRWIIGGIVVALFVGAGAWYAARPQAAPPASFHGPVAIVGGTLVRLAIADTPAERELGLGGRTALAPDEGMLFVFPQDGRYSFWMKDMHFAIDIVWIAADGTVIFVAPSVSPDTYPHAFTPPTAARYVLELPAGFMEAHGVMRGASITLSRL